MNTDTIQQLAQQVLEGKLSIDRFVDAMSKPATARLSETSVDLDRTRRCGYPEVIYGEGKSADVLADICRTLIEHGSEVLATRVDAEKADALLAQFPPHQFPTARYNSLGRTFRIAVMERELRGCVAIVTAGTSDLAVAEEARETIDWMGCETRMIHDVGVAGPHRLRERLDELKNCAAVVVVAGMEGALPSVVGGYVPCPVIAVPTSVGYGASFGGVAALLGMLNSCAANVTVVNIDAGFKGGYVAGLIARQSLANQ